jgi:hypothetical protein
MSANETSEIPAPAQAIIGRLPHLRLVQPTSPPRRRLAVRISVFDGRLPFGRSKAFRLTDSDIDELIAVTQRMERRP